MKTFSHFLTISWECLISFSLDKSFLLIVMLGWHEVNGQLTFEPTTTNGEYQFALQVDRLEPIDTSDFWQPFYMPLWIFGNGEYYPHIKRKWGNGNDNVKFCWENYTDTIGGATLWHGNTTYRYPIPSDLSLEYSPIVLYIPRKGDPTEPGIAELSVAPHTITPSGENMEVRETTIPPNKSIYVTHSQGYLANNGDIGIFIVSYNPTRCLSDSGHVYLYYGCGATGVDFFRNQHLIYESSFDPTYYGSQPHFIKDTISDGATVHTAPFANRLDFPFDINFVNNASSALGVVDDSLELRLFEQVRFAYNPRQGFDSSFVLAVITSKSDVLCDNVRPDLGIMAFLDTLNNYYQQFEIITTYDQRSQRYIGTIGSEYIIDVDTMFLQKGPPHDPNSLIITRVPHPDSLCSDTFQVSLRLEFKNLGEGQAEQSVVNFEVIDTNFVWCRLIGLRNDTGQRRPWRRIGDVLNIFRKNKLICGPSYTLLEICDPIPSGESYYVDVVINAKPSAFSSRESLVDYLKHHRILKADVTLDDESPLTVKNDYIDKHTYDNDCAKPPIICKCASSPSASASPVSDFRR